MFYQSAKQGPFLASVSAYYDTPAQAIFVGALIGTVAAMIALRDATRAEEATRANVQNNVLVLLVVGALSLAAAYFFGRRDRVLNDRWFPHPTRRRAPAPSPERALRRRVCRMASARSSADRDAA